MNRIDNSEFLLYIEPRREDKSDNPINDEITEVMKLALSEAKIGTANYSAIRKDAHFSSGGWRGIHTCDCGERSDNHDYLLKNGMIVNSLCVFYLQYYRSSIPISEMDKVMGLVSFYQNK